jgi:hypothetical protein
MKFKQQVDIETDMDSLIPDISISVTARVKKGVNVNIDKITKAVYDILDKFNNPF